MSEARDTHRMKPEDWAADMGERWNAHLDGFEGMIAPVGEALLAAADFAPGDRVLDVGCGGGLTSLAIARRVAPGGRALGLDVSPTLVRTANRRAREAGADNVAFEVGDAASCEPAQASFDWLFSRFGLMFFDRPHAAFAHLHGLLRPGARVLFAVWGPPEENPWMREMMAITMRHVDVEPPQPRAPGPFALADPDYVRELMDAGGFRDVTLEAWRGVQYVGGHGADPDRTVDFVFNALAIGDAFREQPEAVVQRARDDFHALFSRHHDGTHVTMPGMAWFVSARA